jgi:hypothetical protein
MENENLNEAENPALNKTDVSGSLPLADVQACIQNALYEKGINLFECLRICDNILKHFDECGLKVVRQ